MRVQSRIITIAAALALTATPVLAQVSVGGRLGGAMANLSGDGVSDDASSRIGFSVGAFADISVGEAFSIQPEVLFATKGTEAESEVGGETITSGTKLSYIQVPVTAKYSMPMSGSSIQPYLFAGPSIAFNLGCTVYSDAEGAEDQDCAEASGSEEDVVETIDFSLLGGVGAGFAVGNGTASIDVRYDLGLTNVNVAPEGEEAPDAKNRAFSVTLGYSIPLGM